MTRQEAIKLLALIKVAYPTAYRDMDQASKQATVNMWQMSFPDVPFLIMEQAFNHFRMVSKYPPTVAEMVEELRHINYQATENALICSSFGEIEEVRRYEAIIQATSRFKDANVGYQIRSLALAIDGGEGNVQGLGASRDNHGTEDRLSLLDAGGQ